MTTQLPWQHYIVTVDNSTCFANGSITRLPWQYHNVSLTGLSLWQHCHYDNTVTMTTQLPWQHYIVTVDNSTCFANGSITRLPWQYHNVSLTGLSLWQHCHYENSVKCQYDNTVTLTTLHCHGWQQYLFCEWQHYTVTMAISQRFLDRTVTMTTLSLWQHCHYDNTVTMTTLHCHGWQQYLFCEWQHYTVTMAISQRFLDRTVTMTTLSIWQLCHYDNTVTMTTLHCHGWQQYLFCEWQHYTVTMAISQRFLDRTVTMTTLSIWQHSYLDNTTLSRLTTVPVLQMAASHGYHGNITTFPWQDCHYDNTVTMTTLSLWQHSYHDNITLSRLTTVPVLRMAALHGYHGNITTFPWQDCHYDNTVTMTTQLPWQHYIVTVDNSTCFANGSITRLPWQYHNVSLTGLSLWQHCHYDNTVTMATLHCHGWQQYLFCEWQHYTVTMAISQRFLDRTVTMTTLSLWELCQMSIWQHSYLDNTTLSRLTTVPVLRMAALHGYHGNITTFPWQDCHYDNTVTMTTQLPWQHYIVTVDNSTCFANGSITRLPWQYHNVSLTGLSLWQHCHYDNTVTMATLHCHGWQQYLFCEWQHYTVTMAISQRFLDRTVTMTTLSLWQHCHYDNSVNMTTQLPWQHYIVTVDNSTCFANGSITRLPWQYHNVSLTGLSLWQHCHYDNTVTMATLHCHGWQQYLFCEWQHYTVTMAISQRFLDRTVTMTTLSLWELCQYDNTVTLTTLHCHGWQQYLFCEWQHYTVTMAISQRFLDRTVTMKTPSLRQHSYHDNTTLSRLTTVPVLWMAALHGYHGNITTFPWQDCHYDNTVSMITLSLWQLCQYDNTTLSRLTTVPVLRMAALHGYHGNITTFPWQDCHYDNTVTMRTLSIWQHSYHDNTTLSRLTTVPVLRMAALHGYHGNITTFPWQDCHYDNTVTMTTLSIWQHSYHDNTTLSRLTTVPVLQMAALHGYHGNITTFPWQDCHYDNTVTMTTQLPWQHYIVTVDNSTCFANGSITRLPKQYHNVSLTGLSLWQHCHYENSVNMTTQLPWQHYIVTVDNSTCFANDSITRLPWQYHNVSLTGLSLWQHCHYDNSVNMTTHLPWQHYIVTVDNSTCFANGSITRLPWQYHNVSLTGLSLWQHCHYDNSVNMTTQLPWQHYIVTVDNSTCFANGSITRLPWQYHNLSLTGLSLWQHCHYDNSVNMTTQLPWQHYIVTVDNSTCFANGSITRLPWQYHNVSLTGLSLWQQCHYENSVKMTTQLPWQHYIVTVDNVVLWMAALHGYHGNITTFPWQDCHYDNNVTMKTLSKWQHSYLDNTTLSRLTM